MQYLNNFFLEHGFSGLLLHGIFNPLFVLLSVLIAIFASSMAMQIAGMARASSTPLHRRIAIATGSLALGGGIWAMHFVGELAFELCTPVQYAPLATMLSMLPGFGASWVALSILTRGEITLRQLIVGGVLVGAGIGAMHYSGMTAMEMNAVLRYDPWMFALSIVVAVVLAMLALWVRFGVREWRSLSPGWSVVVSGIVMGLAISGMHYTGMAAARFIGTASSATYLPADGSTYIALTVSFITVVLSILVVLVNGAIRYRNLYLQMRFNESRLQAIFDTAVDGIITINGKGIVQSMNRSAERLFGWSPRELVGKNINVLMPEPNHTRHDSYLANYMRTGKARIIGIGQEVVGMRKDGSLMPIRLAIGKANLPDPLFVGFIDDISQRKEMEQALRKSEQQYKSLISNIPGASFRCLLDDHWTIVFISDAIFALSGWGSDDFRARHQTFAQLIHPEDRQRVIETVNQAIAEERNYVVEYRIRHRDGHELWLWESGGAVLDEQGQAQWIDGVILDISERRAMEEELRNAKDRAELAAASKTAFLANMSHEIRTPMNAIIGFTELLMDGALDDTQRRHLGTVRQSARSLLGLLNDILDTAKLEKGAVALEHVDFSLMDVVNQVTDSLRLSAESKGLRLTVDYHPESGAFFRGDPLRVWQVLTNLTGNAIKFTERGSVRIEVFPDDGKTHIAVHDTGIGIAEDRLEKIFAPFAQADVSMSRRFGGTGLGTTIARQLVELMGGSLKVESSVGLGSVFHVLLPLENGDAVDLAERALQITLPSLRILAVDDVPQNTELLSLMLSNAGHRVNIAYDGAEAVRLFTEQDFDVLLMDIQMPGMDGLEATRKIRLHEKMHARRPTPVIALSASVMDQDRQEAHDAGMNGFSSKPVELGKLLAEIARVTGVAIEHRNESAPQASTDARKLVAGIDQALAIDWHGGIGRWGNRENMRQAIRRFLDENKDTYVNLGQALRNGDEETATQQAHRIRGVTGNLGLPVMHRLATQLEDALRGRQANAASLLPQLMHALTVVHDMLESETPQAPAAMESSGQIDQQALIELAQAAIAALQRSELDETVLRPLRSALRSNGAMQHADAFNAALEDFDFDRATGILREVLSETNDHTRSALT